MFWSWSFFIIITSHRTLCYWWKCSWNAVHVSLPVQRPVVLWLHSDRLLRKTSLVCGRNKISNWTLGLLPSYLWVLPMKAFVLKSHIHRVHVHWLKKMWFMKAFRRQCCYFFISMWRISYINVFKYIYDFQAKLNWLYWALSSIINIFISG